MVIARSEIAISKSYRSLPAPVSRPSQKKTKKKNEKSEKSKIPKLPKIDFKTPKNVKKHQESPKNMFL